MKVCDKVYLKKYIGTPWNKILEIVEINNSGYFYKCKTTNIEIDRDEADDLFYRLNNPLGHSFPCLFYDDESYFKNHFISIKDTRKLKLKKINESSL